MSRPLRIQYPGAVYHIINRGRARQPTFVDETDYRAFLDILAEAHRQWGIEVFAYSLREIIIICVLELRGETSPGSCATSTASIPSDSTGAIGAMGHCFGAAIRAFSSMPMNIWRRWYATFI